MDLKSSSATSTDTDELSPIVYLSVTFPNNFQRLICIISFSSLLILTNESFKSSIYKLLSAIVSPYTISIIFPYLIHT